MGVARRGQEMPCAAACGNTVYKSPSQIAKQNFCSPACRQSVAHEGWREFVCQNEDCKAVFVKNPNRDRGLTFCSVACYKSTANATKQRNRGLLKDISLVFTCSNCKHLKPGSMMKDPLYCNACATRGNFYRKLFCPIASATIAASQRKSRLWTTYQLTIEAFETMLNNQDGACALCVLPFSEECPPVVDHDHTCCSGAKSCGKCVRALLHAKCNTLEGMVTDEVVANVLAYRARFKPADV